MSIRRARTIDDLYDEVDDYDLVLTTDAPLSQALNRRIDRPRLGTFAATPRMLASGEFRPRDDRQLFLELIDATDLNWKHAAYLLESILGCWEETGDLRAILEYDQFDTRATRRAIDVIDTADSAHNDLTEYTIPEERSVAVIGEEQFTALDRSVLPDEYETVDPFGGDDFELPEFHLYESTTDIVDTVVSNVTPENAEDVAIIMDRGSEYPALVESALEANDIPFYGGPGFADDESLRTFIRLLRTAHADRHARLGDVRPILHHLGIRPSVEDDNKRLHELDHPEIEPLQQFCETIHEQSIDEALSTFETWCDRSLDAFREELDRLGVRHATVGEDTLDGIEFYLQSFDVPIDRDDAGVLLADATAAAYVDRPVVFHLGMDADWTHRILDRPWIDADAKDRQYLRQFQLLLQNGNEQYFLVQETSAGEPVTPCLYFHDLLDAEFDTFGDLPSTSHTRFTGRDGDGFEKEPVDAEPTTIETLSPSSLSTFANCPRDYFFDRVVTSPDRDHFQKGNLFHDFAEFYVNHPDIIHTTAGDELVDRMLAGMRPYVDDVDLEVLRTEFEIGIDLIQRFLTEEPPTKREYEEYGHREDSNFFADHFGQPINSPITERWFENPALGGEGKVDLIHSPSQLVDYKSGSHTSASKVVDKSAIDEISDEPDFQALLYLAHHRRVHPDERIRFVFFHFLELVDEEVVGEAALEDALARVTYHPEPFHEFAKRRAAFDTLREGVAESNDRRKTLERMGYDVYETFFDRHDFPDVEDTDALLETDFAAEFTERAKTEVGDYVYVDDGTDSALKELHRLRGRNYFEDEVDAFERFLQEQVERINEYRRSRFPVGDPNVDRVDHRDLIQTDD
ncbi:PD-(D/E)XK nuclease family protein [Halobellus ruber]|uniref:PD-(D/E)XK nuclease family protein n=1 Tax=Halobellus ruber TaxID=2761102 RepID=A0A7J9SLX9_9EURY|nr:PD-(D/E)XK nuclease family protein [Halobellus ruber]